MPSLSVSEDGNCNNWRVDITAYPLAKSMPTYISLQALQEQQLRRLRNFLSAAAEWKRPRVERFSSWQTGSVWPQRALTGSSHGARVLYWNMKWCVPLTLFSCSFCARTTAMEWWSTSAAPAVASSAELWVQSLVCLRPSAGVWSCLTGVIVQTVNSCLNNDCSWLWPLGFTCEDAFLLRILNQQTREKDFKLGMANITIWNVPKKERHHWVTEQHTYNRSAKENNKIWWQKLCKSCKEKKKQKTPQNLSDITDSLLRAGVKISQCTIWRLNG